MSAQAVLNGLFGDVLHEQGSGLAISMSVSGERAGTRLCLFVPGLMNSDAVWRFPGAPETTYGSLLAADRGVTPLFLSYNSGRHVSSNGRDLAALLDDLVAAWPAPVEELTLVGYSMGGLVARSACHYAVLEGRPWAASVRRVFLLGAPVAGVPLEKLVHVAACTLTTIWNPVTRLIGRTLNRRSAGIKDLRYGLLVDEDWHGRDPDALAWPRRAPAPLLETADHYVIVGSLGADDRAVTALVGDPLVTSLSARGQTLSRAAAAPFPASRVCVLPGTAHWRLAHDRSVYEQMLAWWAG